MDVLGKVLIGIEGVRRARQQQYACEATAQPQPNRREAQAKAKWNSSPKSYVFHVYPHSARQRFTCPVYKSHSRKTTKHDTAMRKV
jgi:hypothetical protein